MEIKLTSEQKADWSRFRDFMEREIAPQADRWDQEERMPLEVIRGVARQGYLGIVIPEDYGGAGKDMVTFGLLNEESGRACSSVRSLLTVHCMVAQAINRWGSRIQKQYWLPKLSSGEVIAAFAITEPGVGSDAASVETRATLSGDAYELNGRKRWISFGQVADLFLVLAQIEQKPTAFLVERSSPGLSIDPISGMLGLRASMLAELQMVNCRISAENLLGKAGLGFSHVASAALDYGRYSVAWGCVGIIQACLEASLHYSAERKQFGCYLKDHQLIQRMLTQMIARLRAARLLCYYAGQLKDKGDPLSIMECSIAKYFASTTAVKAASDAVQIHGANGCGRQYKVQRLFRDSKIMEIIEGSTQIQEVAIAKYGLTALEHLN